MSDNEEAPAAAAAPANNVTFLGQIGRIDNYNDGVEDIDNYLERLDNFFEANQIPAERQAPSLLSLVGPKVYKLLKSLTAPDQPKDKTFEELCTTLRSHFKPKASLRTRTYRFQSRKQRDGESLQDYLANLKELSIDCEFGTDLERRLCDGFVYGLRNENTKVKLLAKPAITLDQAVELAAALDQASADAKEISNQPAAVHAVNVHKRGARPKQSSAKHKPQQQNNDGQNGQERCYRCNGKNHRHWECYFKDKSCHSCGKTGHIPRACKSSGKQSKGKFHESGPKATRKHRVHQLDHVTSDSETEVLCLDVNSVSQPSNANKFTVAPRINGSAVQMEIDTGSAISLITRKIYDKHFSDMKLRHTSTLLKTFSDELIQPLGCLSVSVRIHGSKRRNLILYVTDCGRNPLFGRDWLRELKLNWSEIKTIQLAEHINTCTPSGRDASVTALFEKHKLLFSPGIGKLKDRKAKFALKPDARPIFLKARVIPFSLRDKVKHELDRLQAADIISPVKHSDYATPIVPVMKRNGSVRICGDFKSTLNKILEPEQYPLPRIDEIFASFAGGQKFSKLDLTEAYLAYEIDEEHRKYFTISTPWGLYQYNRMLYGIADAPSKWQRVMDELLLGIPFTKCILDDILVSGKDDEDHLRNLSAVMKVLEDNGLKANLKKTELFRDHVDWCGHRISASGLEQNEDKVKAVNDAPAPKNVSELRSWIGMVTYYHKFLPDLASKLQPLYKLLQRNTRWEWSTAQQQAFDVTKRAIASHRVLTHYDPDLPLILQYDASLTGLGAVLSHRFPDGSDRPILFLSRTLRPPEKNYSQLDLEATAIFWATKKLIHYLYGRHFTLVTDNYPVSRIFHSTKALPQMSAMRLQRYAIFLSGLNYTIEYRSAKHHGNADSLSRLPLRSRDNEVVNTALDTTDIIAVNLLDQLPVDQKSIKYYTQKDPTLSRVMNFVLTGDWTEKDNEFQAYYRKREELSCHSGVLFWGHRVIIPPKLEQPILDDLHESHAGISRTKSLARSYFWFPNIDNRIEAMIKNCNECAQHVRAPPASPILSWPVPDAPWERLHIDHAFYEGKILFCVIDAYSKYPHASIVKSTDSDTTIAYLQQLFSMFGLPKYINCDNATSFTSEKFKKWCSSLGIILKFSNPFRPATNACERLNGFLKTALKCMHNDQRSLQSKLNIVLMRYRITPHPVTNEVPSKLLLGRVIRNRFSLLHSNTREKMCENQLKSAKSDRKLRQFDIGERVLCRDYRESSRKWQNATVTARNGPLSYTLVTDQNAIWRRHADQLVSGPQAPPQSAENEPIDIELPEAVNIQAPVTQAAPRTEIPQRAETPIIPAELPPTQDQRPATPPPLVRRSTRQSKPPSRLGAYITH